MGKITHFRNMHKENRSGIQSLKLIFIPLLANQTALNNCMPVELELLSPAFSKKSGGTLFSAFSGAWHMVRGSEFLAGTLTPPTVFVRSF